MGSADIADQKRNEYRLLIKSPRWFLFFWDDKCLHFTPAFSKPQGITQLDVCSDIVRWLLWALYDIENTLANQDSVRKIQIQWPKFKQAKILDENAVF